MKKSVITFNYEILLYPLSYLFVTFQKTSEATTRRCSVKNLFLEILQNSQNFREIFKDLLFHITPPVAAC